MKSILILITLVAASCTKTSYQEVSPSGPSYFRIKTEKQDGTIENSRVINLKN